MPDTQFNKNTAGSVRRTIDDIHQKRDGLATEAKTILERSTDAGSLSDDDKTRFDAIEAELGKLKKSEEDFQRMLDSAEAGQLAVEHGDGARMDDEPRGTGIRDTARRALDSLRSVPDDGKQRLTRAFERAESGFDGGAELNHLSRWLLATSEPAYARAVGKLFRDPENGHREFTADELNAYQGAKQVQRAMSIGTDSAGGFLLPSHLDPQILLSNAGAVDPIRRIARVETIGTDTWNGISSAGVTASWDAEAAEVSDDSPTLASPSVPTHKGAAFVAASIEAAMDTSIGAQVATLFIDAKQRLEAAAFIDGSGSGQPTGVTVALPGGSKVAAATADTIVAADVTGLQNVLPSRWQPRAQWAANLETINTIAAFETSAGALRFPEMANDRLLRKPFNEASTLDAAGDTATAGNDNVLLYGDFQQYLVVDRVGTTVEFIPHLFHTTSNRPSGQRGWYMFFRTGGDVLIDAAFRLLTA